MPDQGMAFIRLNSQVVKCIQGAWEDIAEEIKRYFKSKKAGSFVLMHHGVCLGSYEDGDFIMPSSAPLKPEYLRFARIFNADGECYVWRSGSNAANTYGLRIRHDEEDPSEPVNAVEAKQLLWGTCLLDSPLDPDWKVLKEDRGIELLIHQSLLPGNIRVTPENRLWLVTRNYIGYSDVGQVGYIDSRFVTIEGGRRWEEWERKVSLER